MNQCESHYPIMGRWNVIAEDRDSKTWQCPDCKEVHRSNKHKGALEFVPDSIKEGRRQHRASLLQPFRGGEVSKEYLDAYPEAKKGMIKEGVITREQAKKAKNVWGNDDLR